MDKFDVVECRFVPFLESALNERTRIQAVFLFSFLKNHFPTLALSGFPGFLGNQTLHLSVCFFLHFDLKSIHLIILFVVCFFPVLLLTGSEHLDPRFLRSFTTFKPSRIFLVPKDLGFLAITLRFTFYLLSFPVLKIKFEKALFSQFFFLSLIYRIVLL